jgi:hypothetical protein
VVEKNHFLINLAKIVPIAGTASTLENCTPVYGEVSEFFTLWQKNIKITSLCAKLRCQEDIIEVMEWTSMRGYLPNPSPITDLAKTADKISISSAGICGEDDFKCSGLNQARLPVGMRGGHTVKERRYALDMEGFSPGDNYRIIAVSKTPS